MITSLTDHSDALDVPAFRPELAFPLLPDDMIQCMRGYASEVATAPAGTQLFSRGQRATDLFVILEGAINIYTGDEARNEDFDSVIDLTPRQFTGELNLLNQQGSLVTARITADSLLLRLTRADLQRLMQAEGDIANLIMQAFIWRRIGLAHSRAGVVLIGNDGDAETVKLQRFLRRNGYPHRLISERAYAPSPGISPEEAWPAVSFHDGLVLHRPTVAALADRIGVSELPDASTIYDVAVVGAGPAGLAAAVYAASEGLCTVVIEGIAPGGQAGTSSRIENYLGFPTGISGQRLAHRAWVQALKFGVRFAISRDAVAIRQKQPSNLHEITLEADLAFHSRTVVIATGAQYRKLPLHNFEKFENQGIYYAATGMEAQFCREKEIIVVGGGNSAGQAALFLSQQSAHVYLMVRGKSLSDTMSQYLLTRIQKSPRITILTETEISGLDGDSHLEQVTWVSHRDGSYTTKPIQSVFAMVGAQPNTTWLNGVVALDEKGFVITDGPAAFDGTKYATNVPGIYAVGDVRTTSVKRVASAVGEGSVVISDVHRYLTLQKELLQSQS